MEPFQERVVAEKTELDSKIEKLSSFMCDKARFEALPFDERTRLYTQLRFMRGYSSVLADRIAAFT